MLLKGPMRCPTLSDLPPPPPSKTGWAWTVESPQLPEAMADGKLWPRISIVTPSYNQGQYLEETIRSVLLQGYPDLEYQVLDGGSNDQSIEIIRKYEPWLANWRSEKDGGQAAAINLGLKSATGVWFQNINSDDVLEPGALGLVGRSPPEADLAYGDVLEFSDNHTHLVANTAPSVRDLIRPLFRSDRISWHQPGLFLKRQHMLTLGGYDASLGYLFDLHLTARYVEQFPRSHRIDATLVRFRIHGEAKSSAWGTVYETESVRARELLASQLLKTSNRQLARREANRRRLHRAVAAAIVEGEAGAQTQNALQLITSSPTLVFDRMFLGAVRRRSALWFRAAFTR